MTRRPADPATRARLERLRGIARMKADAELARLAISAQGRARLLRALEALGRAEEPLDPAPHATPPDAPPATPDASPGSDPAPSDPALVRARLAHARWIDAQRRMLNQRLALVQSEYLALRPHAQRAFGRAEVLDRLQGELAAAARHAATRRDETS